MASFHWVFTLFVCLFISAVFSADNYQETKTDFACMAGKSRSEQIICVGDALKAGAINTDMANRFIKRLSHDGPSDRSVYAWGISDDGSLEIAKYYDPSGSIIEISLGHLRWTAPRTRVVHARTQRKVILAYSWGSIKETKPIEHWFDMTSISGDPGANWAFAEDGHVNGMESSATTISCAGLEGMRDALSTKQSFVTYFMNPTTFCKKFDDRYQTVVGKYKEDTMIVRGKETKAWIPLWECAYVGTWACSGIMTTTEKARFTQIVSLN